MVAAEGIASPSSLAVPPSEPSCCKQFYDNLVFRARLRGLRWFGDLTRFWECAILRTIET